MSLNQQKSSQKRWRRRILRFNRERSHEFLKRLGAYFWTGVVVLSPVMITVYIFAKLFVVIDGILGRILGRFLYPIPGLGFVTLIVLIVLTGMLARNVIGRTLIRWGDQMLTRIPLMNRIYIAVQQISQAFLSGKRVIFQRAVLIEYPRKGLYCIGFLTSTVARELKEKTHTETVSVFLPTTPNPTSGFLLFVPREEVVLLDMSIEEALKLVISGGTVTPADGTSRRPSLTHVSPVSDLS